MSEISDMIQRLCPDGVEYRKLGEVCSVVSAPKKIDKGDYQSSGMIPIVDQGKKLVIGYTNDCYATVPKGCYVIFGDHTREIKYVDFDFAQGADGVKILKANNHVDIRYLFHAMTNLTIPSRGYNRHWTIARDLEIPVPPLEVQRKIVEVLDNFSELTAELTAELEARKKQYEYYRDNLLNFNRGQVDEACFSDICSYTRGVTYNRGKEVLSGNDGWKVLRANNISLSTNTLNFDDIKVIDWSVKVNDQQSLTKGDIIICAGSGSKEHVGKVAYINDDMYGFTFGGFMAVIRVKQNAMSKYVFQVLKSRLFKDYLAYAIDSSTINNLNSSIMNGFTFPLPSLAEQNKIVSILEEFDTLANDLTSGLPAEIKARQQQYEYYRDQLLTFKRAN